MTFRCPWGDKPEEMTVYHDLEWGVPVHDDRRLFEFLVLESAQAGLSWLTILRRREGYRKAFAGFDPEKVAVFDTATQETLRQDPGIIRNRLKIASAVNNARRFLEVRDAFGSFSAYLWDFVNGRPVQNEWAEMSRVPATSPVSDALAKDMKSRGFTFVGSTILYAYMQATGMVNDHLTSCFRYEEVRALGEG
jgi:DNA-3-methyladenine glycosylase I